jgi:hypothetical protein
MLYCWTCRAEGFTLVLPNRVVMTSRDLLANCDGRAFEQWQSAFATARGGRSPVFENGTFINFGQGCLRDLKPGRYQIIARLKNQHVVLKQKQLGSKTAVGSIESLPLTIDIIA